jgi:HK97 gp10 family phage protein
MNFSAKVEGLAELEKQLLAIEDKTLSKKVMRKAFMQSLSPIWKEARALAPVQSGDFRKSISRSVRLSTSKLEGGIRMITKKSRKTDEGQRQFYSTSGWMWHFFEYGTSGPYPIKSKKGKVLGPKGIFGKVVIHPGIKPRPFLRPAWDSNINRAIDIFRDVLAAEIKKAVNIGK